MTLCFYVCIVANRVRGDKQSLEHIFHLLRTLILGNTHASLSPSKTVVVNIPNAVTMYHSSSCGDPNRKTIFAAPS